MRLQCYGSVASDYEAVYRDLQWKMFPSIGRVYLHERARKELGWLPRYDFHFIIRCLKAGVDFRSPLARSVGSKGYHDKVSRRVHTPWNRGRYRPETSLIFNSEKK